MKHTIHLNIKMKEIKTAIYFDFDLLRNPNFLMHCKKLGKRFAIITDQTVEKLYGKSLLDFLTPLMELITLHAFPAGEQSKTRAMKEKLEDALFQANHSKDSALIVIGGGGVTDLGGFIASTFCRGVPFLSIPTSLVGMIDASIGGKTGVNTPFGKNLIGTIYSPEAIFIDLSILQTLPDKQMREGAAEIIKYGLIFNSLLFDMFIDDFNLWDQRDFPFLKKLIYESCLVKKKVIQTDLKEKGMRRSLNFGHTIGHAIETLEEYRLSHGEAIAIGLIVESYISMHLKKIKEYEFDQIYNLMKNVGFLLKISQQVTSHAMLKVMKRDKKNKGDSIRCVVLDGIGKVLPFQGEYCKAIPSSLLIEALEWMVAEFYSP